MLNPNYLFDNPFSFIASRIFEFWACSSLGSRTAYQPYFRCRNGWFQQFRHVEFLLHLIFSFSFILLIWCCLILLFSTVIPLLLHLVFSVMLLVISHFYFYLPWPSFFILWFSLCHSVQILEYLFVSFYSCVIRLLLCWFLLF